MASLSEISIRRPVFAWMLMVGLIGFGALCFSRMGISQLPDVDFPVVTVAVSLEGAAPEVMEADIVDIIEDSIMSIEGVRSVTSASKTGQATITAEFNLNRDIEVAVQDIQGKIAQVQRQLPREMDPPVITKTNPDDQPIMFLGLTGDASIPFKDMVTYVKDTLKDQFSTVAGVGEIIMPGYVDPNLRIWVSDKKLNQFSLSAVDVINTVQNEHSEPPAGQVDTGNQEFNVRMMGEAATVDEFSNLSISLRGNLPNFRPIKLNQVARVEEGLADIKRISRSMKERALGLGIKKQRGSNAVAVAQAVKKRLAEVQKGLPKGMKLGLIFDTTRYIEQAVGELNFTLLISAILTALVCWLFLGSWSSTLNVLMAIPTSIVGAFTALYFMGFTLNTFTLLGLSLAIGIVVDDAIMVLENIIRHKEMGKDRTQAALDGSREITFAAIAATISVIAIFLPVAFMKGIIGKFFFQFGVTMTVAVALSLLEALTLTPMRCAEFVDSSERTTRIGRGIELLIEKLNQLYRVLLARALGHKWKVILGSIAFCAASFTIFSLINKEFLPQEDQGRFLIRITTPVGSSLAYTDSKMKLIEEYLGKRPEIDSYFTATGGFGTGGDYNAGNIFVSMKDRGHRGVDPEARHELSQHELMGVVRKEFNKIPDLRAVVQDFSLRGFSASRGFPVEFTVQGPSWEKLATLSAEIMKRLEATGLVTDLDTDYQEGMPEIRILPDREKATARGVSVTAIGQTINAMIGGVLVGRYPKNGHRYDIRLKLEEDSRMQEERIKGLYVRNNRGELVALSELVTITRKPTLQVVSRLNRERSVTIFSNVKIGKSQQAALEAVERVSSEVLPSGYHIILSGSSQTFKESISSLVLALVLGLFVAYMVLASQFNSFIDPLTVLMALPFSISGALVGLLVAHQSINIYSMIGLILLMGIVKKNSILLVDFTNQVRERGEASVREALLKACPVRLRPILMTSIATIVGAIPPAIGFGPGAESRVPMAVAVIGGVLVSTLLTLFLVPCVYSVLSRFERG